MLIFSIFKNVMKQYEWLLFLFLNLNTKFKEKNQVDVSLRNVIDDTSNDFVFRWIYMGNPRWCECSKVLYGCSVTILMLRRCYVAILPRYYCTNGLTLLFHNDVKLRKTLPCCAAKIFLFLGSYIAVPQRYKSFGGKSYFFQCFRDATRYSAVIVLFQLHFMHFP